MPRPSKHVTVSKKYWHIFNLVFYEVVFLLLAFYAFYLATNPGLGNHPWLIGDWLVNYQGGFVRRGLVGELLLRISLLTGVEISILALASQLLCYMVFLQRAYSLSARSSFTAPNAMLICSPAFILFPVLDQYGGFRKELLLFVLLSVLCYRLGDPKARVPSYLPTLTGLACIVLVLSHEMLIVFFPYLICVFLIHDKELGAATKRAATLMVPSAIVAALTVVLGRGDNRIVMEICRSLRTSAPPDCLFPETIIGAITFLGKDLNYAHSHVLVKISGSTLLVYAVSAVLSFTPVVLKLRSKQFTESLASNNARVWILILISSSVVATLPLLWIVADYGRLIYIHVTCLSLLTLMATQERTATPLRLTVSLRDMGVWLLVVLYVAGWRLLHVESSPQKMLPLLSAIAHVFSH